MRNNNRSSKKIFFLSNLFIKYTKLYHPTKEARSALSSPFIKSDLDKYPDSKIINYLKKDINEEFNFCIQKIKIFSQKFHHHWYVLQWTGSVPDYLLIY